MTDDRARDEEVIDLGGGVGAVVDLRGEDTQGRFAVVHHPLEPGGLIEPHTHALEDEWSYVLSGAVAVQLGGDVLEIGAGQHVYKPRGLEHAVWNAHAVPATVLELIVPAGFEHFFEEAARLVASDGTVDENAFTELLERYAVSMAFDKAAALIDAHGLTDLRTTWRQRDGRPA